MSDTFDLHAEIGKRLYRQDPADDGMEVFIIRETKRRSQRYYDLVCVQAKIFRDMEDEHILEVERKFIREVEALAESTQRTNF